MTATERIQLEASGIVDGDLRAPKLLVEEGAVMNGTVEMTTRPAETTKAAGTSASRTTSAASETNPASPPAN